MLDVLIHRRLQRPLEALARMVVPWKISADAVTLTGFCLGLCAIPCLAWHTYPAALVLILLNRFFDGLDGALARIQGSTDFGGYLDIVCDFIFYAGVVWGMALARPEEARWATLLVFSFMGTATSFLAYAILAAKLQLEAPKSLPKSFYYLGGLTEGTETILFLVLFCLFPTRFALLAMVFSVMCWITTGYRIWWAWFSLKGL